VTSFDPYEPDRRPEPAPVWQPPQAYYPPQPYAAYPVPYPMVRTSGLAVAGMVLGILALVGFWIPFADLLLGFLAIGLSWAGIVQSGKPGYTGHGMAVAGLICGILGVLPAIIVMLFFFGLFAAAGAACGLAC